MRIGLAVVTGVLLLTTCAAGVNPEVGAAAPDGGVCGLWLGLWHGIIAPVTFVISLFTDSVSVYEGGSVSRNRATCLLIYRII